MGEQSDCNLYEQTELETPGDRRRGVCDAWKLHGD